MRILSVDEIPKEWKGTLTQAWLARYQLFCDEIRNIWIIQWKSIERVADILKLKWEPDFPYSDLRSGRLKKNSLKILNRPLHMWVLVKTRDWSVQFIKWILEMDSIPDLSWLPFLELAL